MNVFQVCQRVEEGLRSHDTGPCLAWCHDNRSKLRRLKSTLEYRVRLQDFIELIRQERRIDAVKLVSKLKLRLNIRVQCMSVRDDHLCLLFRQRSKICVTCICTVYMCVHVHV